MIRSSMFQENISFREMLCLKCYILMDGNKFLRRQQTGDHTFPSIQQPLEASSGSSFPRLIVVPAVCFLAADKHEIDGVRKEKERLTAASISCLLPLDRKSREKRIHKDNYRHLPRFPDFFVTSS